MSANVYYRCEVASEAESECKAFFDAWRDGQKKLRALLKEVNAQQYDERSFLFHKDITPGVEFVRFDQGARMDELSRYRINLKRREGKAFRDRVKAAEDAFPDRFCFHLDVAGFPPGGGRFTCAYPVKFGEAYFIVVPVDSWDGKKQPPTGAIAIKASEFYLAKEAAESAR